MNRFLIPHNGEMIFEGQLMKFWAVSYENGVLGKIARLHFFNNSGGCDGKVLDWLLDDAPIFMREMIQNTQAEIKSWSKAKKKHAKPSKN